jgi:hypothetical protein
MSEKIDSLVDGIEKQLADYAEQNTKLRLAATACLLFHSSSPWDFEKRQEWNNIGFMLLEAPKPGDHNYRAGGLEVHFDGTTRTLCDMMRAALK